MSWEARINGALRRVTGLELRHVPRQSPRSAPTRRPAHRPQPDRLLTAPVFVLSSVRSGSTLLRVLLDSHPELHSPVELHLRGLKVNETSKYVSRSMRALGISRNELEHLLWDRVLHHELRHSGKRYIVNKTPSDALIWRRIVKCWPDARFIYLLRHPVATARSWQEARPYLSMDEAIADILRYMNAVEEARTNHPGLTVRYEDLTADPERETRRICDFLEVEWDPRMLDYGQDDHGGFRPGLGDWGEQIKSGQIRPARTPEDTVVPEALREIAVAWGYLREPTRAL
ncbi:MAG: sulfotransferase family protein [Streptosporangiaceae bacterium]